MPPLRDRTIPEPPALTATSETVDLGNALYHQHCAICHRGLGVASIVATASPDLRMMTPSTHEEFSAIVLSGSKKFLGMPGFAEELDERSSEAVRAFVTSEAIKARKEQLE